MAEYVTLKKHDGTIIYPQVDPKTIDFSNTFYPGQLLAVARNTATLEWYGTTPTVWSVGTWSQYGMMAQNTNLYRLQIDNTTNKTMTILLELNCPTVCTVANTYTSTYLWEVDSSNTRIAGLANAILSCNNGSTNIWAPVYLKKIVTVAPNTTKYFIAAVYTSSNNTCKWFGGDTTTSLPSTTFGGDSCIISAKLLNLA